MSLSKEPWMRSLVRTPVPQSTWLTPRSATEGRVPAVILTAVKTLKQGTCCVLLVGLSDFTL